MDSKAPADTNHDAQVATAPQPAAEASTTGSEAEEGCRASSCTCTTGTSAATGSGATTAEPRGEPRGEGEAEGEGARGGEGERAPRRRKKKPTVPSFAALELTYACNHSCPFCSNVWKDPEEKYPIRRQMNGQEWIEVIDKLAQMGVSSFCLTGGEPSMHPDFMKIVEHMCDATYFNYCTLSPCGVGASILTNGDSDIYTPDFAQYLSDKGCQVSVSLLDDTITGPGAGGAYFGGYARSMETARVLLKAGVNVTANVTLCNRNLSTICDTVREILAMGCKTVMVMRPMLVGRGKSRLGQQVAYLEPGTLRSIVL
ncbi:hypothetical protein Pelo_11507 [Pelomyxa schiedti]|nr:hypothetical protein Pelo_11507 [Pelomyxa schiedti]